MKLLEIFTSVNGEIPKNVTDKDRLVNYIKFQIYMLSEYDAEYWDYIAKPKEAVEFYKDLDDKLRVLKSDLELVRRT